MKKISRKEELNFKESSGKYKRTSKSTLIKETGELPINAKKGLVVSSVGLFYKIKYDKNGSPRRIKCFSAGTIITKNSDSTLIAVGDYVYFVIEQDEKFGEVGYIVSVEERKNCFSRLSLSGKNFEQVLASNIDNLLIMQSAKTPRVNKRLIDRFLVAAELNSIKPIICINKIDLIDMEKFEVEFLAYYELGVPIHFVSVKNNIGLDDLKKRLKGKISVLSGPSGVGKSSILNYLMGEKVQSVKEISKKSSKGVHTTSFAMLFEHDEDSQVIDTPGIREFGIWGIEKNELPLYFHEFDPYTTDCRFNSCSHIHEPGCKVIEALEEGKIDLERYESYINIFDSLED
jgi:ribosome biogenesis GTPase / thiamine phosphate phosphatase